MKKRRYFAPTLRQSLILILLVFAGMIMAGIIPAVLGNEYPDYVELLLLPISYIPAFLYFYIKSYLTNEPHSEESYMKINDPNFRGINPALIFIIALFSLISLTILLDPLTIFIKAPEWYKEAMSQIMSRNIVITIISVAVYAAVFEEFFCRALILRGMLRYKSPVAAILISSFIFGFIHFNFFQGVPAFAIGCLFGWLYYKTRSIWLVMFLHFTNNALSTVLEKIFPDLAIDASIWEMIPTNQYILLYTVSMVILCLSIYYINRKIKINDKEIISDQVQSDT